MSSLATFVRGGASGHRLRIAEHRVVGAQDVMTPLACSEEIRDAIMGTELHLVLDSGHLPPMETAQVVADMLWGLISEPPCLGH